jgi:hypothetical protein
MRCLCVLVLLLALHAASCEGARLKRKRTEQVLPQLEAAKEDVQHKQSTGQMYDVSGDEDNLFFAQKEVHTDDVKEVGEEATTSAVEQEEGQEEREEDLEDQDEVVEDEPQESEIVVAGGGPTRRRRACLPTWANCNRADDCCSHNCFLLVGMCTAIR